MTDHDSGAKDRAKEGGVAGATGPNVVPFPRSWYGAVEELVPISADPPRRPGVTPDATAFWGGDPPPVSAVSDVAVEKTPETAPADAPEQALSAEDGLGPAWAPRCGSGRILDWSAPLEESPVARSAVARKHRPRLALLVMAVGVALFFVAGFALAPDRAGRPAGPSHTPRRHRLPASIATNKPAQARGGATHPAPHATVTRHPARKDPGDRHVRPARHAVASVSAPSAQTQPATHSSPVVASVPPVSGSTSTTGVPGSTNSGGGSPSTTVGASGSAGALPDIHQTNEQP